MAKLPSKLSRLLVIAVRDSMKVEKMRNRILDMTVWHEPSWDDKPKCTVCMAGAVMDRTLKVDSELNCTPSSTGEYNQLLAINDMRRANVFTALNRLSIYPLTKVQIRTVERVERLIWSDYSMRTNRASWQTYLKAAGILKRVKL